MVLPLAISTDRIELLAGTRDEGEPNVAVIMCNDYLRLGPTRKVGEVARRYNQLDFVRPISESQVQNFYHRFNWKERAEKYDVVLERTKNEEIQAELERALNTGIALVGRRMQQLNRLNEMFWQEIEENGLWVEEHRQIAGEEVINKKWNKELVRGILDTLADAAHETGGRHVVVDQTHVTATITAEDLLEATKAARQAIQQKLTPLMEERRGA